MATKPATENLARNGVCGSFYFVAHVKRHVDDCAAPSTLFRAKCGTARTGFRYSPSDIPSPTEGFARRRRWLRDRLRSRLYGEGGAPCRSQIVLIRPRCRRLRDGVVQNVDCSCFCRTSSQQIALAMKSEPMSARCALMGKQ